MKRVLIGGIGNVLLGDDGIGPYTVCLLEAEYEFAHGVHVEDLGTPALNLIARLCDIDVLILVDSVETAGAPGTVTLYRRDEIIQAAPKSPRVDPHSPALSESLMIADLSGQGATEVLLICITGERYEPSSAISPAARQGARQAVREVLEELDRLGISYTKRPVPAELSVWWEPDAACRV